MGVVKTKQLDNGNIDLEITYGGLEAPFGGVDASMPPRYIDPKCQQTCRNFVISAGQLVATGLQPYNLTLTGWNTAGSSPDGYLGSGSFFQGGGYYNWVLSAATQVNAYPGGIPGNPKNSTITYKIWIFPAGATGPIAMAASCVVTQGPQQIPATPATAQLVVVGTQNAAVVGNATVIINSSGVGTVINVNDTPQTIATNVAASINGAALGVTASVLQDGITINIVTTATGTAPNANTISVTMTGFPVPQVQVSSPFSGGTNAVISQYGLRGKPLSWVAVGESLYFGGPSTMIMQYQSATNTLSVLTQYLGANTLAKFNSQLIAAGVVPGPGTNIQFPEMVVAWSAPQGAFSTWNPLTLAGTVTGAGFNQEADISDYITGLFIIPGTAALLRTQGIDYLTPLQNGVNPFDFEHISNGRLGEGAQDSRLVCQYDMAGFYVGNSDVYVFDGKVQPVGSKIKNLLVTALTEQIVNRASAAGPVNLFSEIDVFVFFLIDYTFYIFNTDNKSWTSMSFNPAGGGIFNDATDVVQWSNVNVSNFSFQFTTGYTPIVVRTTLGSTMPTFWSFQPTVQSSDLTVAQGGQILFPQEEISFGRDITIDALLASISGTPGQVINFTINATYKGNAVNATAQLVLPPTANPNVYVDYQIFFNQTAGVEVPTGTAPQLEIDIPLSPVGVFNQLSIEKISMFGSYDPNQRPV